MGKRIPSESKVSGSEKIQEKIAKTRACFSVAFSAITRPNSRAKRNFMHFFVSFPAKRKKAQRRNRRKDQWRKRRRTEQRTKRRRTDQRRRTELWHLHHLNETNLPRQECKVDIFSFKQIILDNQTSGRFRRVGIQTRGDANIWGYKPQEVKVPGDSYHRIPI